jgi:hypothetical protein
MTGTRIGTNRARFEKPLRMCDLILPHDGEQNSRFPMCPQQPYEVLTADNG